MLGASETSSTDRWECWPGAPSSKRTSWQGSYMSAFHPTWNGSISTKRKITWWEQIAAHIMRRENWKFIWKNNICMERTLERQEAAALSGQEAAHSPVMSWDATSLAWKPRRGRTSQKERENCTANRSHGQLLTKGVVLFLLPILCYIPTWKKNNRQTISLPKLYKLYMCTYNYAGNMHGINAAFDLTAWQTNRTYMKLTWTCASKSRDLTVHHSVKCITQQLQLRCWKVRTHQGLARSDFCPPLVNGSMVQPNDVEQNLSNFQLRSTALSSGPLIIFDPPELSIWVWSCMVSICQYDL